ncbi:hypothetical protein Ppa05_66290 [Planomonospora parontospora subsp. antibiotica]|nr:hypothetical protein Ppa05_66290 [Planomonospora parontospora subsp. antibiotica]
MSARAGSARSRLPALVSEFRHRPCIDREREVHEWLRPGMKPGAEKTASRSGDDRFPHRGAATAVSSRGSGTIPPRFDGRGRGAVPSRAGGSLIPVEACPLLRGVECGRERCERGAQQVR